MIRHQPPQSVSDRAHSTNRFKLNIVSYVILCQDTYRNLTLASSRREKRLSQGREGETQKTDAENRRGIQTVTDRHAAILSNFIQTNRTDK